MAKLQLRPIDDFSRLFSALGEDPLEHESYSLSDIDEMNLAGLNGPVFEEGAWKSMSMMFALALATGWVGIKGYERNLHSMPQGLAWAATGFFFPIPAVAYTMFRG